MAPSAWRILLGFALASLLLNDSSFSGIVTAAGEPDDEACDATVGDDATRTASRSRGRGHGAGAAASGDDAEPDEHEDAGAAEEEEDDELLEEIVRAARREEEASDMSCFSHAAQWGVGGVVFTVGSR